MNENIVCLERTAIVLPSLDRDIKFGKVVDELYKLPCELLADGELCEEKIRELRRTRSL